MGEDKEANLDLGGVKGNVVEMKQPEIKPVKEKISYEQLEQIATQASQQAKKFYMELQQANYSNALNRMGMLFEVLHYSDKFNKDFVQKCTEEIEGFLTIVEQPVAEESK